MTRKNLEIGNPTGTLRQLLRFVQRTGRTCLEDVMRSLAAAIGVLIFAAGVAAGTIWSPRLDAQGFTVVRDCSAQARQSVHEVVGSYRRVFEQQSVLWESSRVCGAS
jgi:hypothetical protein